MIIITLHGHYNYNEDFCGKGKEMVSFFDRVGSHSIAEVLL